MILFDVSNIQSSTPQALALYSRGKPPLGNAVGKEDMTDPRESLNIVVPLPDMSRPRLPSGLATIK